MTPFPDSFPIDGVRLLASGAWLGTGIALGLLHFGGLRRTVSKLARGGSAFAAICWTIGRFALLGGGLSLAGRQGVLPLLCMAGGVLAGRIIATREPKENPT